MFLGVKWRAIVKERAYYRRLACYFTLFVLVAVVLTCSVCSLLYFRFIQRETETLREQLFFTNTQVMDSQLRTANDIGYTIMKASCTEMMTAVDLSELSRTKEIIEFSKLARSAFSTCELVEQYFVYIPHINRITSSSSIDADIFLKNRMDCSGVDDIEAFKTAISKIKNVTYIRFPVSEKHEDRFLEIFPIFVHSKKPTGYLCMVLSPTLSQTFTSQSPHSADIICISDANQILFSTSHDPEIKDELEKTLPAQFTGSRFRISGKNWKISLHPIGIHGLQYIHITSDDLMLRYARNAFLISFGLCAILSIVCSLIALSFTKSLYQPVGTLVNSLTAKGYFAASCNQNELLQIGRLVDQVLFDNKQLTRTLDELRPMLDTASFQKLLHAKTELLPQWINHFSGRTIQMLVFRLARQQLTRMEYSEESYKRILITYANQIQSAMAQKYSVYAVIDGLSICVIVDHSDTQAVFHVEISGLLEELQEKLSSQYGISLLYTVSKPAVRKQDIAITADMIRAEYYACVELFHQAYLSNQVSRSLWLDDHADKDDKVFFGLPLQDEQEIVNLLHCGDPQAWSISESIILFNLIDNVASYDVIQKLLVDLLEIVYKSFGRDDADAENILGGFLDNKRSLLLADTLDESMRYLNGIFEATLHYFRGNKSTQPIKKEMLDKYLNEHWNADISLTDIAEHFHFSTGYVSRICHDVLGESFADYLNRIRISRAKMLIASSSLTITDIAEQTGFTNYKTFARYFKKYTALSPSDYKQLLQAKADQSDPLPICCESEKVQD